MEKTCGNKKQKNWRLFQQGEEIMGGKKKKNNMSRENREKKRGKVGFPLQRKKKEWVVRTVCWESYTGARSKQTAEKIAKAHKEKA